MSLELTIILSVVNIINIVLHVLGCSLLAHQYRNGVEDSQQLFLINLSVTEAAINLLQFLINVSSAVITNSQATNWVIQHYVKTLRGFGFVSVYYLTMIYLTLDKMFDILLSIRYPSYWNEKYTRYLLKGTWVVSIITAITVSIIDYHNEVNSLRILDMYIYPALNIVFLITAFATYIFIFHKYKQTRSPPTYRLPCTTQPSAFEVFRKSRFHIPVLLISTTLIFQSAPGLIQQIVVSAEIKLSNRFKTALSIFWSLSYFSDAVIYIWIKVSVRELLKGKVYTYLRKDRIDDLQSDAVHSTISTV